jgi:hypothetical protein
MPVSFECECGNRSWSPPDVDCTICGPLATSVADPIVWSVDRVPGTEVFPDLAELVDRNVADRLAEMNGAGPLQRPFHVSLGSSVRRGET